MAVELLVGERGRFSGAIDMWKVALTGIFFPPRAWACACAGKKEK